MRLAGFAVLLLLAPAAADAAKPAPCPEGPFVVDGAALVAGAAPVNAHLVTLGPDGVAVDPDCFATTKLRAKRNFTRVRARFKGCGGFRAAKLVARIAAPDCNEMIGTFKPKGAPVRGFRAVRIRCGDGRFDAAGEACDAGVGCGPEEACTADCGCVSLVPTTTTSSATSTSSSRSSSSLATTTTSSTTPPPTLNFSLPPVYGSTALTSGFVPDPFTVGITAGGPADATYLGGGCLGRTTSAPSFSVNYTAGAFPLLRFYFVAASGAIVLRPANTTMIINTPGGSYVCVDDSFDTLHPTIDFNSPSGGRYDVWIAMRPGLLAGDSANGTLYVTENSGNHPEEDDGPPVIGQ